MKALTTLFICSTLPFNDAFLAKTLSTSFLPSRREYRTRNKEGRKSTLSMYVSETDVEPKVSLVTGSSRGLGKAMALELAKNGCKVVINYIEPEKEHAMETVEEIEKAGGEAFAVMADCTKPEEINAMFEAVTEKYGGCDILVNNAGITKDSLVLRMKPNQWEDVIKLNLSGVHYCTQAFIKSITRSKKKHGRVIDIASISGQIGNVGQANYSAAKGGVIGLCRSNAKEFARSGVTVNCICPGFIATEMTKKLGEEMLNQIAEQIPLKRLGKPEEVAGLCRFLAVDPAAEYITGHCFDIDGGLAIGAA